MTGLSATRNSAGYVPPREGSEAQHEPFERRQLIKLKQVLNEVGVTNELSAHGIDARLVCDAFYTMLGTDNNRYKCDIAAMKQFFKEQNHPLLLGILLGIRIRERGGTTARDPRGLGSITSGVELVDTRLTRDQSFWDYALKKYSLPTFKDLRNAEEDTERPAKTIPGFSVTGMRAIRDAFLGYTLTTADEPAVEKRAGAGPLALDLFITGLDLGLAARRAEGQRYSRNPSRARRPQAFFVTNGFDVGQQIESPYQTDEIRVYARQRHAQLLAALFAQGARDMVWWPLHSNMRPGDVVLLTTAEPPPAAQDEPKLKEWCCGGDDSETCNMVQDHRGVGCVRHLAIGMSDGPLEIPGLESRNPHWNSLRIEGDKIWGIGLVTVAPDWTERGRGVGTWRGRVGFIRWLPVPIPITELKDPEGRFFLPQGQYEMSLLQFDSDRRSFHTHVAFAGSRWAQLKDSLTRAIESEGLERVRGDEEARDLELHRWKDDLARLMLCSENLSLGAQVKSLKVVAPPFYYPLGPVLGPVDREYQDELWQKELNDPWGPAQVEPDRKQRSINQMRGVVSTVEEGNLTRKSLPDDQQQPQYDETLGRHENRLLEMIGDRCRTLEEFPNDSYAVTLLPATLSTAIFQALRSPLADERLGEGSSGTQIVRDPQMLLPLDPGWSERRVVWRFRIGPYRALYLGLVPNARGSLEGSILQDLVELRHFGSDEEALKLALGLLNHQDDGLHEAHEVLPPREQEFICQSIATFRAP